MSDQAPHTAKDLWCSVLRQADYLPGSWLLSDRHASMSLITEAPDKFLAFMQQHRPDDMPMLLLVREQRPDRRWTVYAKPLWRGTFTFGGNWLWSDDPRFPADHPVPIHDSPASDEGDDQPANPE